MNIKHQHHHCHQHLDLQAAARVVRRLDRGGWSRGRDQHFFWPSTRSVWSFYALNQFSVSHLWNPTTGGTSKQILLFQLEDFLKGYEEQEASVWIDLGCEGEYVLQLYLEMRVKNLMACFKISWLVVVSMLPLPPFGSLACVMIFGFEVYLYNHRRLTPSP